MKIALTACAILLTSAVSLPVANAQDNQRTWRLKDEGQAQGQRQTRQVERQAQDQRQAKGQQKGGDERRAKKADMGQKSPKVVMGKVVDSRDVELQGTAGDAHRLVQIENRQGDKLVVDLGLSDKTDQLDLKKGDRLVVIGKPARIDDRPVIFAISAGELHPVGHQ